MTTATRERSALFTALAALAGLGILLQAVWAGLFIREGEANDEFWVDVHARGAEVTIVLALAAAVVANVRLRSRRDLRVGSVALVLLLALEAYLGGEIFPHFWLEVVHFPLAFALLVLAVWLPIRAGRPSSPRTAARPVRQDSDLRPRA
jgi:heme A synthase